MPRAGDSCRVTLGSQRGHTVGTFEQCPGAKGNQRQGCLAMSRQGRAGVQTPRAGAGPGLSRRPAAVVSRESDGETVRQGTGGGHAGPCR